MNSIFRKITWVIYSILRAINLLLFILPARFTILSLASYLFLFHMLKGSQEFYLLKRELGGEGTWGNFAFTVFILFPIFWSFINCFSATQIGDKIDSVLDSAIQFRNSRMRVNSAQTAFKILQKSSLLDTMKANENDVFKDAAAGFRAEYGASPPNKVIDDLVKDE